MARPSDIERYEEWRSTFTLSEDGPHTFRQLDKLRQIDNIVWSPDGGADGKLVDIAAVLSE